MNERKQLETFCSPALARLGSAWLKGMQSKHVTCRKTVTDVGVEFDEVLVDGRPVSNRRLAEVSQFMAAHHCLTNGLKIVEVSEAEAEMYRRTELHAVGLSDWRQSYPLVVVRLPPSVFPHLVGVVHLPELGAVNMIAYPEPGVVDHLFVRSDFEAAFSNVAYYSAPVLLQAEVCRVAVNAVLHLANYPDLYARHAEAHRGVRLRPGDGVPKRREIIPQIIRLAAPAVGAGPAPEGYAAAEGHTRSPHWRRGHWRRLAVGPGRSGRRHHWIKPVLVNACRVQGELAGESTFRRA